MPLGQVIDKKEQGVVLSAENTVVEELERLLSYHKLLGIDHYPSRDDLTDFLAFEPDRLTPSQPSVERLAQRSPVSLPNQEEQTSPQIDSSLPTKASVPLQDRCTNIQDLCVSCGLRSQQKGFVPGKGGTKVRLLVVGGWLINNPQLESSKATFGVEEDLMLARMFSAMKLAPTDVFVTNLVKCCLEKGARPSEDDLESCQRLLQKQIVDLEPEVICAMGTLAAQTLLQKERSLSQLRGKFFQTEVVKGLTLPVFATYHPSYLVNNDEMKVPTWEDLQKIARRLAGKKRRS